VKVNAGQLDSHLRESRDFGTRESNCPAFTFTRLTFHRETLKSFQHLCSSTVNHLLILLATLYTWTLLLNELSGQLSLSITEIRLDLHCVNLSDECYTVYQDLVRLGTSADKHYPGKYPTRPVISISGSIRVKSTDLESSAGHLWIFFPAKMRLAKNGLK
jgi:hypothetical protein